MKVKVLKKTQNELKLEVKDVGHALCNILQKRLLEDKDVDLAGYDLPHPLASNWIVYVRTKGDAKPKEALKKAVKKALGMNKEFTKEFKKALKT